MYRAQCSCEDNMRINERNMENEKMDNVFISTRRLIRQTMDEVITI